MEALPSFPSGVSVNEALVPEAVVVNQRVFGLLGSNVLVAIPVLSGAPVARALVRGSPIYEAARLFDGAVSWMSAPERYCPKPAAVQPPTTLFNTLLALPRKCFPLPNGNA